MTKQKVLIIDHDDSFTYLLGQKIGELCNNTAPEIRNHTDISIKWIKNYKPTHIVLSPGPGSVINKTDFKIGHRVIQSFAGKIPILGVCLGHQGIAHYYGAKIVRAPKPIHGKSSQIIHNNSGLFHGLESPLTVMRYHSLCIDESSMPTCLKITAKSHEDGVIMAIKHVTDQVFGIQFHPESIGTPLGFQVLRNFLTVRLK